MTDCEQKLREIYDDRRGDFYGLDAPDIKEHLETLRKYGEKVDVITEFGVRMGSSTRAWLLGEPKRVTCYDIKECSQDLGECFGFAAEKGIDFKFIVGDSLEIESESCDLLFVDTVHTYKQLTAELDRHGDKVKKYIICHDTVYDAGCLRAIKDYITRNSEWAIKEHFTNCNGLTVLERTE